MLITENDTSSNSKCLTSGNDTSSGSKCLTSENALTSLTSSDSSLEEKQTSAPKFNKARVDRYMNANMLVPFIHLRKVQPPKPKPSVPKGRGCKKSSQLSSITASAETKIGSNKRASSYVSERNKKARVSSNESVANSLLALAGC
jgi:hypothetical protein